MNTEDPVSGPAAPKVVPTLTEIVPGEVDAPHSDSTPDIESALAESVVTEPKASEEIAVQPERRLANSGPTSQELAQAVLVLLGPQLDALISEAIARVLHEQMLGLNGRVRKAVAEVVHEAVAKALTQGTLDLDVGENP